MTPKSVGAHTGSISVSRRQFRRRRRDRASGRESASGARSKGPGPESGLAEKGRWSSRCVPLRWSVRWSPP